MAVKVLELHHHGIRVGPSAPEVKQALAFAERSALANAVLESVVAERTTDAAVKAWYDEHAVQFNRPQVKARHILFAVKPDAKPEEKAAEA